jgi:hypothetical protein
MDKRSIWRQHEADQREANESGDGGRMALEIAREAPIAADPGKGSFDDPPFG